MGILVDAVSIALGCLLGGKLEAGKTFQSYNTLGIGIMLVSVVGCLENIYQVEDGAISSSNLIMILLAFFIGSRIGEILHLEERLGNLGKTKSKSVNVIIDTTLFFAVGGLQISGPIALALNGDSSQLYIKSIVDFPFAVAFGSAYGAVSAVSALPVAGLQILIAFLAIVAGVIFSAEIVSQLCAIGYIILFFSGLNLMTDGRYKIPNINMIPGMLLVVLINFIIKLMESML